MSDTLSCPKSHISCLQQVVNGFFLDIGVPPPVIWCGFTGQGYLTYKKTHPPRTLQGYLVYKETYTKETERI